MYKLFSRFVITETGKYHLLYKVPDNMNAYGAVSVCNMNSGNVRMRFAIGSFPPEPRDFIYYDQILLSYQTLQITDICIDGGESLSVYSDTPNIAFRFSADENLT